MAGVEAGRDACRLVNAHSKQAGVTRIPAGVHYRRKMAPNSMLQQHQGGRRTVMLAAGGAITLLRVSVWVWSNAMLAASRLTAA